MTHAFGRRKKSANVQYIYLNFSKRIICTSKNAAAIFTATSRLYVKIDPAVDKRVRL